MRAAHILVALVALSAAFRPSAAAPIDAPAINDMLIQFLRDLSSFSAANPAATPAADDAAASRRLLTTTVRCARQLVPACLASPCRRPAACFLAPES